MKIKIEKVKARIINKVFSTELELSIQNDNLLNQMVIFWQISSPEVGIQDSGNLVISGDQYNSLDRSIRGIKEYCLYELNLQEDFSTGDDTKEVMNVM